MKNRDFGNANREAALIDALGNEVFLADIVSREDDYGICFQAFLCVNDSCLGTVAWEQLAGHPDDICIAWRPLHESEERVERSPARTVFDMCIESCANGDCVNPEIAIFDILATGGHVDHKNFR